MVLRNILCQWCYELFINFRLSVHLRVESAGAVTIKIFRKIMFDFKRIIHQTNSASKPSQFPFECLRRSLHDGKTIEEVYSEAKGLTNLKRIQNIKQKVVKEINPVGHSFDALAEIKEATDKYDPYLLWKVKDGRLDGSTIVFRRSRGKLEIAVQMQLGSQHSLEEEDCFLDADLSIPT